MAAMQLTAGLQRAACPTGQSGLRPSHRAAARCRCLPLAAAPPARSAGAAGGRARRLACRASAAGAEPAPAKAKAGAPGTIPKSPKETVEQAAAACERAWATGVKRHRLELLLPLIGATDIDDWPGGIRQQFKAASPMCEQLLQALRQLEGLQGGLKGEILDDGDAVGAWVGTSLAAVLFPTAETLGEVRKIADGRPSGLTLIINPQWRTEGNVIGDFGIFPWERKAKEELVASFTEVYMLRQLRISGDEVRLRKSYPGGWEMHVAKGLGGEFECVLQQPEAPSYSQMESVLRALPWSQSSKPLLERVNAEMQFLRNSLDTPPQRQQDQQ